MQTTQATYISVTETAAMVRKALKAAFPGTKFSVRSSKYSGGASIDVVWRDGPCRKAVEQIAGQYEASDFDGMIDMKVSHTSWRMPDGSAIVAHHPGTLGQRGTISAEHNDKPHPDAVLVRFGADYVHCYREHSVGLVRRAVERLERKGYPTDVIEVREQSGLGYVRQIEHSAERTRGFDMEREVTIEISRTHCVHG